MSNYEHTTEIIKNMTEVLATLIEGMRPMNEPHWKRLTDILENRQGLRSAFIDWKTEARRLRSLAPLDFQEALDELADETQSYRGTPHARSA